MRFGGMLCAMDNPVLVAAVHKLTVHGLRAGLTTDQMMQILEAGFTVEDLVRLIDSRLPPDDSRHEPAIADVGATWRIMLRCVRYHVVSYSPPQRPPCKASKKSDGCSCVR